MSLERCCNTAEDADTQACVTPGARCSSGSCSIAQDTRRDVAKRTSKVSTPAQAEGFVASAAESKDDRNQVAALMRDAAGERRTSASRGTGMVSEPMARPERREARRAMIVNGCGGCWFPSAVGVLAMVPEESELQHEDDNHGDGHIRRHVKAESAHCHFGWLCAPNTGVQFLVRTWKAPVRLLTHTARGARKHGGRVHPGNPTGFCTGWRTNGGGLATRQPGRGWQSQAQPMASHCRTVHPEYRGSRARLLSQT